MRDFRLGAIVRADRGGLAAATQEFVRHLQPDETLLIDLGQRARGDRTDRTRFPGAAITGHRFGVEIDDWFRKVDVTYTIETVYDGRAGQLARNAHTEIVVHAMPELFRSREAAHVWVPTTWALDRFSGPVNVVPIPVALDRFHYRPRDGTTFFHTCGEAMLDRNGTQIVEQACVMLDRPARLLLRGGPPRGPSCWGQVKVEWLPPCDEYWETIPSEADIQILPRRYGGCALPVQEAAAQGIPTIMSDLAPQQGWMDAEWLAACIPHAATMSQMKGGTFPVYCPDPVAVAEIMGRCLDDPDFVRTGSTRARQWAETLAWERWTGEYERLLAEVAAGR